MTDILMGRLFRRQFFGLGDPAVHPTGEPHLFADLARGIAAQSRQLPVVEDAEIVELLFDGGGYVMKFLEIVSDATGTGEDLVAWAFRSRRKLFGYGLGSRTRIYSGLALRP
jgi:hypothetical protein